MFEKGTTNYNLPQWAPSEHPDFLNDMNPAYRTIDSNLGAVTEESANNSQKIVAMEALQTAQGESITQLQTNQNIHSVIIATLQHDMDDAQANIAKNAGDIQVLTADNHEIHQDIAGHLSNYNVLLNWAKVNAVKIGTGTFTYSGSTYNYSYIIAGHHIRFDLAALTTSNIIIPANTAIKLPLTFENINVHNPTFYNYTYWYRGLYTYISSLPDIGLTFEIVNGTEANITINFNIAFTAYLDYDEIISAETAVAALPPIQGALRIDSVSGTNGTPLNEGGENNVTETAGTSEDNAVDNG